VGSSSLTLFEVNEAAEIIKDAVDPDANIIFGVARDPEMERDIRITLIATGFTSRIGLPGVNKDDELNKLLQGMKSEEEMDMPSFLRRPLFSHRKQSLAATKPMQQFSPNPVPQSSREFTTR